MCLLFVTTAVIFFVTGAAFRSFDQDGEPSQVLAAPVIPAQTVVVVVELPPDPTVTRTPPPTIAPSPQATTDVHADDCNRVSPSPGDLCRQPPMATYTAAPIPTCPVAPGDLCVWQESP
jgi:hypothetical protein